MVNPLHRGLMGAALLASALARADGGCVAATEFTPRLCPAQLPAVRSVRVERQGQRSAGAAETGLDCRRFRLSPPLVRRYLAHAQRVEDDRGEAAVDRGPCQVEGTLRFADGTRAQWRIEQVGTATLMRDGSTQAITLYCTRCRFKPFVQPAGR
jgi:hypothetical protein